DATLAGEIAQGMIDACPLTDPADEAARAACAQKLTDLRVLADAMTEPFLWGGQRMGFGYNMGKSTTKFNALVWRRLYGSLLMFDGKFTLEQLSGYTIIHLPYHFRGKLDPGSYPYPFWHSKAKWDSYFFSKEIVLILKDGK